MRICETPHTEVVKLLIDKGAKLNIEDKYGNTALNIAAAEGHLATVKLLVEEG
ncbi:MAG TPA: ankyrin repeat domain-containing protein, partial [Candidatus Wallbacteria bacterium]|nr:ankyrin repeat domain-containing protein [Candidatus Wallbacteria bacterium]